MEAVTLLGSQTAVLGVAGCGAVGLLLAGRRRQAGLMAMAMAVAELLLWAFKISFRRHRPDAFFGLPLPASYSFPSGHSLLSMCCYGTLSSLASGRRLVRIGAAVLVLAIGISRAYLGVHYPTDVIGGFLLGAAWLACLAFFYQQ
jgi:undecaprenyl-diphosphatase